MKLRLKDNFTRIRLNQDELNRLAEEGRVESHTRFAPAPSAFLSYGLEVVAAGSSLSVRPETQGFTVLIPHALALELTETGRAGLEHEEHIDAETRLRIVVEKDFECLHPERADEPAAFPNPAKAIS